MNVLVTGAAGFVGSHLTDKYVNAGDRVVGVDNLITGDRTNIASALQSDSFKFLDCDISDDWSAVESFLLETSMTPDLILHFASPASPVDYAQLPLETMAVNSRGTENCLASARRFKARFLFASTSEAYGDPLEHPQRESYWGNVNSVGPRSCYDESKRFGEALVMSYVRLYDIDARIVRIFNTYGPRMRKNDGRVVPNFIMQAIERRPLTVYGAGTQTRSFCYVSDLVEGIVRCARSAQTRGIVVNLGNPEEYEIRKFAEIVCQIVGVPLIIEDHAMPQDDPGRRCPDIGRARALLGWEPVVTLRDGLRRTLESFLAPI